MQPLKLVEGTAVPLRRSNIDTDQIIPSDWLKSIERTGFGAGLFSQWREEDPDFPLNQAQYKSAEILLAGENFGIGSSREHAVWALQDYGFDAVIAPSFSDIFRNNCYKNGFVPVVLPAHDVDALISSVEAAPDTVIAIDVERLAITCPAIELEASFAMDESIQYRIVNGLDDIALTLQHEDDITAYEARRPSFKPTTK